MQEADNTEVSDKAYNEGRKAAMQGRPISDNPYFADRVVGLKILWDKGWQYEMNYYKPE